MKHIRFVDSQTGAYVACLRILKNHIGWRTMIFWKLQVGQRMVVYQDPASDLSISVEQLENAKDGKLQYRFIYKKGKYSAKSYSFYLNFLSIPECIICNNADAQEAYYNAKSYVLNQHMLGALERLEKPGDSIDVYDADETRRVYDNIADDVGHDETYVLFTIYVQFMGVNPKTNRREYAYRMGKTHIYPMRFIVVDD